MSGCTGIGDEETATTMTASATVTCETGMEEVEEEEEEKEIDLPHGQAHLSMVPKHTLHREQRRQRCISHFRSLNLLNATAYPLWSSNLSQTIHVYMGFHCNKLII